ALAGDPDDRVAVGQDAADHFEPQHDPQGEGQVAGQAIDAIVDGGRQVVDHGQGRGHEDEYRQLAEDLDELAQVGADPAPDEDLPGGQPGQEKERRGQEGPVPVEHPAAGGPDDAFANGEGVQQPPQVRQPGTDQD